MNEVVEWTPDNMIEVELPKEDSFLQVKETLERIGIANFQEKKLWQSCHILYKKGKYYIVHFKEMFALDGKPSSITAEDIARRNRIAHLLADWNLVRLVDDVPVADGPDRVKVFVLKHAERKQMKINEAGHEVPVWTLISKYTIGAHND